MIILYPWISLGGGVFLWVGPCGCGFVYNSCYDWAAPIKKDGSELSRYVVEGATECKDALQTRTVSLKKEFVWQGAEN